MAGDTLERLIELVLVALVAGGAVLLLMRPTRTGRGGPAELLAGYPPDRYPSQALTHSGPLAALAATQARLLSVYGQVPPRSEMAVWLRTFLVELRAIMDTAYRVAAITQVYGQAAQLDALVAEVGRIEAEVVAQVARRLLDRDGDAQCELLDGRLAALRRCASELAGMYA